MAIATPSPSNDAALNAQLDITRNASIANLEQKSSEVQQQYREEKARIEDQKQRSAEVVQGTLDAARENAALRSEAEYNQAFKNFQATQDLAMRTSAANPRDTKLPLELHRQVVDSTHKFMAAQADYVSTHPDRASDPNYNIRLAEDGNGGFQLVNGLEPGLAEQVSITRPTQRQDPNEPLVKFIDQPDGTFDAQLITGETFRGFKANENRDAIRKIAESKVNTRRHYENLAQQQQPANGQQSQPELQQQAQPQMQPGNDGNPPDLSDWLAQQTLEGVAKRFGYQNSAEFVADQNARYAREQQNNAVLEDYKNRTTVSQFFMEHPDYPQTPQADNALEQIINRNGWEWTPDTMAAAHALAVQHRVYQPLSQQEIAVANGYAPEVRRPVPPPIPRGGSPESATPVQDLYEMPLDQLRKQILAGQTGGR
jgi:hypothetical protein